MFWYSPLQLKPFKLTNCTLEFTFTHLDVINPRSDRFNEKQTNKLVDSFCNNEFDFATQTAVKAKCSDH